MALTETQLRLARQWRDDRQPAREPEPEGWRSGGAFQDTAVGLAAGVADLPSAVTGLADIGAGLYGATARMGARALGASEETQDRIRDFTDRPFSQAASALGEVTGFQPSQTAERLRQERYSPQMQAQQEAVSENWAGVGDRWEEGDRRGAVGDAVRTVGSYFTNPRTIQSLVTESLPSTIAGGLLGRAGVAAAGTRTVPGVAPGTEFRRVQTPQVAPGHLSAGTGRGAAPAQVPFNRMQAPTREVPRLNPVLAGALGQGPIFAGLSMSQIDEDVDPARAALASMGIGVGATAVAYGGAAAAQRMGLVDPETAIAGGFRQAAGTLPSDRSMPARVAGGAFAEGVLQDLPQEAIEQMGKNWAEGEPILANVPRASVEGMLAGGVMGGAVNIARPGGPEPISLTGAITQRPDPDPSPEGGELDRDEVNRLVKNYIMLNEVAENTTYEGSRTKALEAMEANAVALEGMGIARDTIMLAGAQHKYSSLHMQVMKMQRTAQERAQQGQPAEAQRIFSKIADKQAQIAQLEQVHGQDRLQSEDILTSLAISQQEGSDDLFRQDGRLKKNTLNKLNRIREFDNDTLMSELSTAEGADLTLARVVAERRGFTPEQIQSAQSTPAPTQQTPDASRPITSADGVDMAGVEQAVSGARQPVSPAATTPTDMTAQGQAEAQQALEVVEPETIATMAERDIGGRLADTQRELLGSVYRVVEALEQGVAIPNPVDFVAQDLATRRGSNVTRQAVNRAFERIQKRIADQNPDSPLVAGTLTDFINNYLQLSRPDDYRSLSQGMYTDDAAVAEIIGDEGVGLDEVGVTGEMPEGPDATAIATEALGQDALGQTTTSVGGSLGGYDPRAGVQAQIDRLREMTRRPVSEIVPEAEVERMQGAGQLTDDGMLRQDVADQFIAALTPEDAITPESVASEQEQIAAEARERTERNLQAIFNAPQNRVLGQLWDQYSGSNLSWERFIQEAPLIASSWLVSADNIANSHHSSATQIAAIEASFNRPLQLYHQETGNDPFAALTDDRPAAETPQLTREPDEGTDAGTVAGGQEGSRPTPAISVKKRRKIPANPETINEQGESQAHVDAVNELSQQTTQLPESERAETVSELVTEDYNTGNTYVDAVATGEATPQEAVAAATQDAANPAADPAREIQIQSVAFNLQMLDSLESLGMALENSEHGNIQEAYNALSQAAPDLNVVVEVTNAGNQYKGKYEVIDGQPTISINADAFTAERLQHINNPDLYFQELLLHEFTHAATDAAVLAAQADPGNATAQQLQDILTVVRDMTGEGEVARILERLQTLDSDVAARELIAYAFSSTEFQRALDSVRSVDGNTPTMWDMLVKTIRRFLGLGDGHQSLLSDIIRVTEGLNFDHGHVEGSTPMFDTLPAAERQRRQTAVDKAYDSVISSLPRPVYNRLVSLKNTIKRSTYASIFSSDLVDMGKRHLPQIKEYYDSMFARESRRNDLHGQIHQAVDPAKTLNATERKKLNNFLRESTYMEEWGFQPTWLEGGDQVAVNQDLARKFNDLTPTAQRVARSMFETAYTMQRNSQQAMRDEIKASYQQQIDRAKSQKRKDNLASEMERKLREHDNRQHQFKNAYLPLKRWGEWVVVYRSPKFRAAQSRKNQREIDQLKQDPQHYRVSFAKSEYEARQMRDEWVEQNGWAVEDPYPRQRWEERNEMIPFDLLQRLKQQTQLDPENKQQAAVANALDKLYIQALSETATRKSELHRLRVDGADTDMIHSFVQHGASLAALQSSLEINHETRRILQEMKDHATDPNAPSGARTQRMQLLNEVLARHALSLDYNPKPWEQKVMGTTSFWMLLTNPAYYLQNMTQPFMLTFPTLSARFGVTSSSAHMTKAYKDIAEAYRQTEKGSLFNTKKLADDTEQELFYELQRRGILDVGIAADLGSFQDAQHFATQTMNYVHRSLVTGVRTVEVFNRGVTALAAYRLRLDQERRRPGNRSEDQMKAAARQYAMETVQVTQGDYSGLNAPRLISMIWAGRLVTQFRKFQLIQIGILARTMHGSFARVSQRPEGMSEMDFRVARGIARRQFGYILAVHGMIGGAMGLPAMNLIGYALAKGMGDEDDPANFELLARRAIGDKATADLILRGLPAHWGVDASTRLGMGLTFSILPFTDIDASRDGALVVAGSLLGPSMGAASMAADGLGQIQEGNVLMGIGQMMPAGARNAIRAYSYQTEGIRTRSGDLAMSAEELDMFDIVTQGLGWPSKTITDRHMVYGALLDVQDHFRSRTTQIKRAYVNAYDAGDRVGMREAQNEWQRLQERRREYQVGNPQPLSWLFRAVRERDEREEMFVEGVPTQRTTRGFVEDLFS